MTIKEKFNCGKPLVQPLYKRLDHFFDVRFLLVFRPSMLWNSAKKKNPSRGVPDHLLNFAFDKTSAAAL
jgi:hypothetical protein